MEEQQIQDLNVVSPVVEKVGNIEGIEKKSFLRFYGDFSEWRKQLTAEEIDEQEMYDRKLQSIAVTRTPTLDYFLGTQHIPLFSAIPRGNIQTWILKQQTQVGMNKTKPEKEWHFDLMTELQPVLSHYAELRKIKKQSIRIEKLSEHTDYILQEMRRFEHLNVWDPIEVRQRLTIDQTLDAIEFIPTTHSTVTKVLSRVNFGYAAINEITYALLRQLNNRLHIYKQTRIGRTRYFRHGKEVKIKQKKIIVQAESGVEQQDSLTQEQNTTFTDQRETVEDDGYITSQTQPSAQNISMPESEWHVRNVMGKPIPFYTGDWSTGQTLGTIIKQWTIPGDALYGPHYNLVSTFTFFRGHPVIRFQINGTKFHSGRLIAAFIPGFDYTMYDDKLYSVSNLTSMPHVILDASIANSGVINLPFVHMNSYFNSVSTTRTWQSLGRLVLVVFNKLRATDQASQNIGVTAWIHYEQCELHQPCFAHTVTFPKSNSSRSFVVTAESGIEGLVKSAIPMVKDLVAPELGVASGLLGNVSGGSANQDKPTDPIEIQRWVPNAVTGLCQGEGIDRGSRLCLHAGTYTIPDADMVSTTQDDMNLKEIMKIPTRLELFDWKSTQNSGALLTHLPICPNLFTGYAVDKDLKVEIITPTLLAYCSRYFKFWRGSIRYKIQIVASQMHTGRLMVSYSAGINTTVVSLPKASYLNTYVIDLQEKHEVEFVVPFLAERPWLRCDRFRKFDETGSLETDQMNFENVGYLDIYVLNRLSRPDSVAPDVAVNIFVSAGPDFEVAFPSELNNFQGIGNPIKPPTKGRKLKVRAESLQTQDTVSTRTDTGSVTLTKGSGKIGDVGAVTMGENATDLKTLLRRYNKVYSQYGTNISDGPNWMVFPNTPTLSGVNKLYKSEGIQTRTALTHFSELFTFWRGSIRYKLVFQLSTVQDDTTPITQNVIVKVFHVPGVFKPVAFAPVNITQAKRAVLAAMESQGVIVATSGQQGSIEFEIPFYTPYTQLRTLSGDSLHNARTATGTVIIVFEPASTLKGTFLITNLYQAGGDDFELNYLRGAPRVQFLDAYETTRDLSDNATWINSTDPPITQASEEREDEEEAVIAEAWQDHIPVIGPARQAMAKLTETSVKVDSVCDTANHLIQQAGKKLGLTSSEEDDEEPTTTLLEDASAFCSPLVPLLEAALMHIKLLPGNIAEHFRVDLSLQDIISEVSNIVSGLTAFMSSSNILVKICAIVTITTTLLKEITTTIKNSIYHFVSTIFDNLNGTKQGNQVPKDEVRAEAADFDLIAPLTATLAVAVGAIGFKKIPNDKETIELCRSISDKLRLFNFSSTALTNVKKLWEEIKELMQWCIDYVMKLVAPELLAQLKLQREFNDIEQWTQFIDSLDNIAYADRIHYDGEFKNKVYRAIDAGKRYNTLLLEGKCGRAANVIREYVRKITEIGKHCENSKNELPFRKDPYCVFMCGTTNIGKSGCITTIGFDIMDRLGYPRHNRWCAVNCTEKYFSENYRQQAAIYFDDFSTFTSEEQYQKFFNLKANTAYPLDMAFRKGEYFNSDFIFGTTNTPYPNPNFITNLPAFLRRRDKLIQADWADEDDIQEALANRENMRRFRKLDNSHLKFRFLNPEREDDLPSPWMTYDQLIDEIVFDCTEHLTVQQRKLTNDLTRAGYIVPQAEAGEVRRICVEAAKNSPSLSLFDPDLWKELVWDTDKEEFTILGENAQWHYAWEDLNTHFDVMGIDLQQTLKNNSYIIKPPTSKLTKVKLALSEFKTFIQNCYKKICDEHPWIAVCGKWAIYLAGALSTVGMLWFGAKKIVHKCMCKALNYYGYRCGLCGRWPKFENVKEALKPFMLEEWSKLYGNLPYKDEHVTSLQEEAALLSVQRQIQVVLEKANIGTVTAAEGIYSDVTKGATPLRITAQNSPYSQDVKGMQKIKVTANSSPYSIETKGLPHIKISPESENVENIINSRIFPYLYKMRTHGKIGLPAMQINGYAIGDRWIMTSGHFFYGLEEGDYFDIFHNGAWMTVEIEKSKMRSFPNKDLICYDLPVQFHSHKSNIHHFISEKDLPKFQAGQGTLCKLNSQQRPVQVDNLTVTAIKELKYEMTTAGKVVPLYIQKAWKYNKCSSLGDCGSLLLAYSDNLQGIIIGSHVGSHQYHSFAQLITREMIEKLVKRNEGTPLPKAEAKLGNLIPPGHLGRVGKALPGKQFFQSPKTEIIPTEIAGLISKPVTEPAVLSSNDPRLTQRVNPLRLGIEKYSHTAYPFPRKHREIVNEMMRDETRQLITSRQPQVLTLKESCIGIPELEGYERLPLSTSPGYPWVTTRPKGEKGKAYLFEEDGSPIFDLKKSFDFRHEKAKKMERVESVWVDCLKDERRPLEKIQKGSTRVFTIPPVEYSLLMRMYTMDFSVAVKNSRHFMDCKVGIDPQSIEWTTLYYWLSEFSEYAIAGDFSRFDGSMPADIIMDVKDDIDFFYEIHGACTEEDKNVRTILFDELIHTVHLARDEYYMTHIGNKSGNPITVILNSRVNRRYIALAWLGLCEQYNKMEYYSMAKFKENVRMADYGDDNIIMTKEEVIEWFNQETIAAYLNDYGIVYTNAEKKGVTKNQSLQTTTFLKQHFRDHESIPFIKVPHMNINTILELLNWTRVAPDQDELLFSNCNDALRFAYFYGEKFYNQLREKIINALRIVGKNWLPKTYMDYHLWFLHTIGMLQPRNQAEGEILDIAHHDTDRFKRIVQAMTIGPLMKLFVPKVKDDGRLRTERLAIVIPSGEGKTWLANTYPQYFVDHDDITLPALEKQLEHTGHVEKLAAVANALLNPQHYDTPEEDKRILLTHHPNATNRTIWRQYILKYPNFNRNNFLNRLILDGPIKTSMEQRNREILEFAEEQFEVFHDAE